MVSLKPLTVIGLNSGTSMDGVDAAVFRIIPLRSSGREGNGSSLTQRFDVEMIEAIVYPFEDEFRKKMQSLIGSGNTTLEEVCRLNGALGEVFAQAALAVMKKAGLTRTDVDLIGSHGQTIWHAPETKVFGGIQTRGTLQLGEPAIIATKTGVPVIADFRVQDMAHGGQGAPLLSFADQVLFGADGEAVGVLNVGGIANVTIIDDTGQATMAFDTGPGNMIMDRVCERLFNQPFDDEGKIAAKGRVREEWLEAILAEHPYFAACPPKTTGREVFGTTYTDELIDYGQSKKYSAEDILATMTALTARTIVKAYVDFVEPQSRIEKLVLGGGGANNRTLRKMIHEFWPHELELQDHEDYGISTKFKEALLFALLAYTSHFGIPNNVPRCTGADSRVCLGKIIKPA